MKIIFRSALLAVAGMALLAGCDQAGMPGAAGGSGVAVIDLAAIAKATGQDDSIRVQSEAARNELTGQLQQLAANLDSQLQAEREKLGANPSEADTRRLQQLNLQAQQQVSNAQGQAQQQAALFEQNLVNQFRDSIQPLARDIASEKGVAVVIASDLNVLWFEPDVDITDEVIAAWRALPEDQRSAAANGAVEAELEETQEELAGLEDEIEELEQAPGDGADADQ